MMMMVISIVDGDDDGRHWDDGGHGGHGHGGMDIVDMDIVDMDIFFMDRKIKSSLKIGLVELKNIL